MTNDFLAKQTVSVFKLEDKVRYHSAFLGRVQDPYGRMDLTGLVIGVKDYPGYQIVSVHWSDGTDNKARGCNLAHF